MRLTREKIIRLSHQITEVLVESQEVEFIDDRDTIRQQVVQILTGTLSAQANHFAEKRDSGRQRRVGRPSQEILPRRASPHGHRGSA